MSRVLHTRSLCELVATSVLCLRMNLHNSCRMLTTDFKLLLCGLIAWLSSGVRGGGQRPPESYGITTLRDYKAPYPYHTLFATSNASSNPFNSYRGCTEMRAWLHEPHHYGSGWLPHKQLVHMWVTSAHARMYINLPSVCMYKSVCIFVRPTSQLLFTFPPKHAYVFFVFSASRSFQRRCQK